MATVPPTILPKDVWTLVLTNVTKLGQVAIVDQDVEPTSYEIALVTPTGADPPAIDYSGGVVFKNTFGPNNETAIDVYVRANDFDGKVVIFT